MKINNRIIRLIKLWFIIILGTILTYILTIVILAINDIDTAWWCVWDYVEKLINWQITWGCGRYCSDMWYHQDICHKSFKQIWCINIAKTNWCSITLTNNFTWNWFDKFIYVTSNEIRCNTSYFWVKGFWNKNWRELIN